MIISLIRILAEPDNKEEILEILFSVKGPTEGEPGCISCRMYQDIENEHIIAYEEVWRNRENLFKHIRSDLYRNILAVMDMSSDPPDVRFNTISNSAGMELIKEALGYSDMERDNNIRTEAR